eukprot:NODE_3011_length_830_cov_34.056338_g2499_i0.p3 GENE.NODE_3011_length_830_cov_34.056338_g2499_i0~~NODE_3011_length_830_cov_34.056338_g2499_i0.p3  ORF type:complete len:95 (+),score=28.12 NODE_3011_length_830_cov_34.056338_g2499_i0:388-672(+)
MAGAKALADGLQRNAHLMTLNISFNTIHSDGAKLLAHCLGRNTVLQVLDLSFNQIDEETSRQFMDLAVKMAVSSSGEATDVVKLDCSRQCRLRW